MKIGNLTMRRTHGPVGRHEVRLTTIHSFKGLESPVVVMTELDKPARRSNTHRKYLLYVGLSRARSHLIIIGDLPLVDDTHE